MAAVVAATPSEARPSPEKPTLTPPLSIRLPKTDDASSSELSDLEADDDLGEIEPDHYYGGGKVPVFKPTMEQFRSFKKFVSKIDKYGMRSGIVKVIPPKEWRDALPALDQAVKTIKVKNPITQEIAGSQGTYRQANIEKQRSYNLPQWRQLCEGSEHQPPARRGERRRNQPKAIPRAPAATPSVAAARKGRAGKARKKPKENEASKAPSDITEDHGHEPKQDHPPTPTSPESQTQEDGNANASPSEPREKAEPDEDEMGESEMGTPSKSKGRQPKSVSSRRKHNRRAAADFIDEAAFKDFDYRITNQDEYTSERCDELERSYWKSITYNSPLYGADMPGSLFDDTTTTWNVAKLENLLDVLGQKVPGVNTAYLYLGMWKSTFAWHLEDVDLYSINYIHFGAPKQWYSISQDDARRFEAAMKHVWPADAKQCSQFLRHKTYLISPTLLQSQHNIRVNRLVHHEGEFVITFPYGYHSGYNLGYNCAESVNFATESWLEYGRVAKKCNCTDDSVWVDVYDIERKLRGDVTEYEDTEGDDEELNGGDGSVTGAVDLPTPPASVEGKPSQPARKRKRDRQDGAGTTVKRIRVRIKAPAKEPCVLCPNDISSEQLLPTDAGNEAHRLCALYMPETFIQSSGGSEKVCNVANIDKARLDLKCYYCRSKRGACFQCSQAKCTRAYHATCAAAAGVLVDMRDITVVGEDGRESTDVGIDFRCRYHRPKRAKSLDGDVLEESKLIQDFARALQVGDVVQLQFFQRDIFAGAVVENRVSEHMVLVDILPKGRRVEIEYKWILVHDPSEFPLPMSLAKARPRAPRPNQRLPANMNRQSNLPVANQPFCDPDSVQIWAEFQSASITPNPHQVAVDLAKPNGLWFYLGKDSTEAKACYTEDVQKRRPNPAANYLDSIKSVTIPFGVTPRRPSPASHPTSHPARPNKGAQDATQPAGHQPQLQSQAKAEKPYQYKARVTGFGKFGANLQQPPRASLQAPTGQAVQHRPAVAQMARDHQVQRPVFGSNSFPQPQYQVSAQPPISQYQAPVQGFVQFQPQPQPQQQGAATFQMAHPQASTVTGDSNIGPGSAAQTDSLSVQIDQALEQAALNRYPYFMQMRNPREPYQSPYALTGGFTQAYLPTHLRAQGQAQDHQQIGQSRTHSAFQGGMQNAVTEPVQSPWQQQPVGQPAQNVWQQQPGGQLAHNTWQQQPGGHPAQNMSRQQQGGYRAQSLLPQQQGGYQAQMLWQQQPGGHLAQNIPQQQQGSYQAKNFLQQQQGNQAAQNPAQQQQSGHPAPNSQRHGQNFSSGPSTYPGAYR